MAASIGARGPTTYNLTVNGEHFRVEADGVQTLRCKVADWLARRSTDGEPVPPCLVKFFHDERGGVAEGGDELPGGLVDLVAVQEGPGNYRKITGPDRSETDFDFMLIRGEGHGPPPDVARLPAKLRPGWYYYNPASEIDFAAFIEWYDKRPSSSGSEPVFYRSAPKNWRSAFFRKMLLHCMDPAQGVPSRSRPKDDTWRLSYSLSHVARDVELFVFDQVQTIDHLTQSDIKQILTWGAGDSRLTDRATHHLVVDPAADILRAVLVHVDVEDAEAWKQTDLKMLNRLRSQLRVLVLEAHSSWCWNHGSGGSAWCWKRNILALQDVIIDLQTRFLSSTDEKENGPAPSVEEVVPGSSMKRAKR